MAKLVVQNKTKKYVKRLKKHLEKEHPSTKGHIKLCGVKRYHKDNDDKKRNKPKNFKGLIGLLGQ